MIKSCCGCGEWIEVRDCECDCHVQRRRRTYLALESIVGESHDEHEKTLAYMDELWKEMSPEEHEFFNSRGQT